MVKPLLAGASAFSLGGRCGSFFMRRIFFVGLGWTLIVVGAVIMPVPVPIPLIGIGPILLGCAILTAHSKSFRRGLQRVRHRFDFVSTTFDRFRERGPRAIRHMVHRTRPTVLLRHARMRSRKGA
jgi:hypothetical protein